MRIDTIQAGDFLRLSARRFPDRDCFVFDDGSSRTFAQVNGRVNQLADALHRRGVRKSDRIALLGTDSGEYVEVMLACMKLGVVYVPLNNRLTDAGYERLRSVIYGASPMSPALLRRAMDTLRDG